MTKFDESRLSAGQHQKLTTLRKSLGRKLGDRFFYQWLKAQGPSDTFQKDAAILREHVEHLVRQGQLRIPIGGFHVGRGRGRIIVKKPRYVVLPRKS